MTIDSATPPPSIREGQIRSAFTPILETLCESCLGAIAAGLIDEEGECVDHACAPNERISAYDIKLAGAYYQIAIRQANEGVQLGYVHQLRVQSDGFDYVVSLVFADYVLVLICRPGSISRVSRRAIRQVEVELAREAGWPVLNPHDRYWRRVQVRTDSRGVPAEVCVLHNRADGRRQAGPWRTIGEVETAARDVAVGLERAFWARLDTRLNLDLVREPTGFWYAALRSDGSEVDLRNWE